MKKDSDAFFSVLAADFSGVYFVNLDTDVIRHLFIPDYFEKCLKEGNGQFSKALILYAKRIVKPEYFDYFIDLCDYKKLEKRLGNDDILELLYQMNTGEWTNLKILKHREYSVVQRETLWIFANIDEVENN